MIAEPQQKYISAEEYIILAQSAEYADKTIELVEGVIVEMSKPGGKHGVITMRFGGRILYFVEDHKLGWVTAAETGYILERNPGGKDTVRGLDIAFVALHRAPDGLPEGAVPFAPDLAVEVISPGNSASEINRKIRELLKAGTRLIWIVHPDTQTIDVHTTSGAHTLEIGDTLDGGDVLAGFTMAVGEVFGAN